MEPFELTTIPAFGDPQTLAPVDPIWPDEPPAYDAHERWDDASVHHFEGTYGDHLLEKVGRVFPRLGDDVM